LCAFWFKPESSKSTKHHEIRLLITPIVMASI
jgi:hypothetical protein